MNEILVFVEVNQRGWLNLLILDCSMKIYAQLKPLVESTKQKRPSQSVFPKDMVTRDLSFTGHHENNVPYHSATLLISTMYDTEKFFGVFRKRVKTFEK